MAQEIEHLIARAPRRERLKAIRAVRLAPNSSRRKRRIIGELLEAVDAAGPDGCDERQLVLAEYFGISDRQLRRWVAMAIAEGVLTYALGPKGKALFIVWKRVLASDGSA